MAKFDWNRDEVTVQEILDMFQDGEEFPDELLEELTSMVVEVRHDNLSILDAISLEQTGIVGKKILKLWNINPKIFMQNVHFCLLIGKDDAMKNLELEESVPFYRDENPKTRWEIVKMDNYEEYKRVLLNDYIIRYNMQAIKEGKPILNLEIPKTEEKAEPVNEEEVIPFNDFYYGTEILDLSGGIGNFNLQFATTMQNMNMALTVKEMTVSVFRKIPEGEFVLLKSDGSVLIPDEKIEDKLTIFPNKKTQAVNIVSLTKLVMDTKEKLESEFNLSNIGIDEYQTIQALIEALEVRFNKGICVKDIREADKYITPLYEYTYGELIKKDSSRN